MKMAQANKNINKGSFYCDQLKKKKIMMINY